MNKAALIKAALIRAAPIIDWAFLYPCQASVLAHTALHVALRTYM